MKLYAGTTEQFMTDAQMHRIAEKLQHEYIAVLGHKPGAAEFNSWQNSLQSLAMLIDQAKLEDLGDPGASFDSIVKRSGDRFTDLVKRTYRVLLTRGMKGCYVYFQDDTTRDRIRARVAKERPDA